MQIEDQATATDSGAENGWFNKRPIPVFIISALCTLQFVGITLALFQHWQEFFELVRSGLESPLMFIIKLLYPFFLLSAGLSLFFMRKVAIAFFGIYLVWGIGKIVVNPLNFPGYLSLALVFGVFIYCLRLRQQRLLK